MMKDLTQILVREGLVTHDVLNEALREHDKTKKSFLEILINSGKVDEKKLKDILCQYYGYASINPAVFVIEPEILKLVPQKIAEKHSLLPISRHEHTLTVAFADPTNLKAIDEIKSLTGYRIKAVVAESSLLKKYIKKCYALAGEAGGKNPEQEKELDELVKMIQTEHEKDGPQASELMKIAFETPVIKLVNMLMIEAVRRHASDIFIEPWENYVRVRARVDGLLEEIGRPHESMGPAIVSRIKIMSELDIAEHRIPQDGRFKVKIHSKEVDMRVSILPTSFGEKVCIRILDTSSQAHDIAKLGFNEREQTVIRDCARKPHGMILVTGPTGSGKTTTLYSVLKYLDSPETNITTVEDPVEYQIHGVNQVNVKETIGLTFPAALRSILRQDPDIILIGEIRDNATMDIAVKAALTGHLVLSTLHTNDATSSITRMMNMGLEPFLISSTVLMISSQRLVRRICTKCKVPDQFDKNILKTLGIDAGPETAFYRGRGCGQCRQSGYKGRTVITEILQMTPQVKALIMKGAMPEQIKNYAREQGMTTLRECALQKAIAGETSLEEVFRVTGEDQGYKKDPTKDDNVEEKVA